MTDERRLRILQIAEELESQGLVATNSTVYARALGHRGHVVQTLKQRRAERAASGGVLVAEAEEDDEPADEMTETPAVVLQEDLRELESSYDAWHLALERLWQIEQDGPLSEANFARKQWLEYQMVQNLQAQERLRPALEQAQVREAVHAAQLQHDARLGEAQALAEETLQAAATLHDRLEDLSEVFARQVDGFFAFRSADGRGMQAFDVVDGRTYAQQLFQQFFAGDPRARDAFLLLMDSPITIGRLRQALAECPRLQPFSPRAIDTYLNAITPQTEGTANGSR